MHINFCSTRRVPFFRGTRGNHATSQLVGAGADTVKAVSDRRARARVIVAFLFLLVVGAALSAGVYYLSKFQENMAGQERRTALDALKDATPVEEALARYPSNRLLKLMTMATRAAIETAAASEKLSREIEPPALAKDVTLVAASRSDLDALRRDLKIAETNATTFMPRYLALLKAERDRLENDARSLNLEKNIVSQFTDGVDRRHAEIAALVSKMLTGTRRVLPRLRQMRRGPDRGIRQIQGDKRSIHISGSVYGGPLQRRGQCNDLSRNAYRRTGCRAEDTRAVAADGMGPDRRRRMTGPKPFGLPPKKLYNFTILIAETPGSRHRLQPDIAAQENVRHSLHGAAKRPQLPPK